MTRRQLADNERKSFNAHQKQEEERINNIRSIIDNKLTKLREQNNIPENLINDVQRQLKAEAKFSK